MKKTIFTIIITAIICITGTVLAVTSISAEDIQYDNTHTVKDKIDDLYTTANKFSSISIPAVLDSSNLKVSLFPINTCNGKYKYFTIDWTANDGASCSVKKWQETASLSKNTDYEIKNYERITINKGSSTGWCSFTIRCHN